MARPSAQAGREAHAPIDLERACVALLELRHVHAWGAPGPGRDKLFAADDPQVTDLPAKRLGDGLQQLLGRALDRLSLASPRATP